MPVAETQTSETPKRRIPIWFILLVIVMLGLTVFGDRGILQVWRANQQKAELEAQIRDLENVNAELRQEIEALRSDLHTIENLARRELGLVREDEMVYQFPPENERYQHESTPESPQSGK